MFEVIYMKAEYEPWWMFDGWEKEIVSKQLFEQEVEARHYLVSLLDSFQQKYPHTTSKHDCFFAFWTHEERTFCEACDDDLQMFHGVLILSNGVPLKKV